MTTGEGGWKQERLQDESTISFINEALKSENSRFLNVKCEIDLIESRQKPANAGLLGIVNESDLIISRQKSGTYNFKFNWGA